MKLLIILVSIFILNCAPVDCLNSYPDEDETGPYLPRESYYNNYPNPYHPPPQSYPQRIPDPYAQPYPRAYPYNPDGGHQEFEGRAFRFPPFKMVPVQFPSFGYFDRSKDSPQPLYPPPPPPTDQYMKGRKVRKSKKVKKVKETPNAPTSDPKVTSPTKCSCANTS